MFIMGCMQGSQLVYIDFTADPNYWPIAWPVSQRNVLAPDMIFDFTDSIQDVDTIRHYQLTDNGLVTMQALHTQKKY